MILEKIGTVPRTIIVTGTDTGVGKTVLASLLTLVLEADYWKPVQSGLEGETDSEFVRRVAQISPERIHPEVYRFRDPLSPDQAARREGRVVDPARLVLPQRSVPLIVEGVGGVMVPMNDTLLQVDLFALWNAPVVVAVRSSLGTLNHTFLTLEALGRRNIPLLGCVVIGSSHPENMRSLAHWSGVPILGSIPQLSALNSSELTNVYREHFIPVEEWGGI